MDIRVKEISDIVGTSDKDCKPDSWFLFDL